MARWGSPAIRGHGIPEAMQAIGTADSRIPARVAILKPLSAAISIGTGGPFGAEGPIIATAARWAPLVGQWPPSSPVQRKILLAAGAAAGMTAIFGTPLAAVLLAGRAAALRIPGPVLPAGGAGGGHGDGPALALPRAAADVSLWPSTARRIFAALDRCLPDRRGLRGLLAVVVTKAVYALEDAFE